MQRLSEEVIMSDFYEDYSRLLSTAFESGTRSVPVGKGIYTQFFNDRKQQRRFISACHRGYDKAQNYIVHLLREMAQDTSLSSSEKQFRELLLRKVADGIALTMLQEAVYVARRLCLHNKAPSLSMKVIQEALSDANKLNRESRQTFALLADLTTFINVADLIRVDFRNYPASVSLIELKSGKINKLLLTQLKNYEPDEESLKLIDEDRLIEEKYKPQAKRMLRQKIRLAQVNEVLKTDKGIDIKLNKPIELKEGGSVYGYDAFIEQLCDEAEIQGRAAGVINYCLHIGVGYSEDEEEARQRAVEAVNYAINKHLADLPDRQRDTFNEVSSLVSKDELFKTYDIFLSNLHSIACQPFVLWRINRKHAISLVRKELCIVVSFDISSFIWLGRKLGVEIRLSSRKEAAQTAQELGSLNVPRWGNRGIICEGGFLLSGTLSRVINDLVIPAQLLSRHLCEDTQTRL